MIWHIAKKDFLLNLISPRFIVGCILSLLIIPFTVMINLEEYKPAMDQYHIEVAQAKQELESTRVYSGLRPVIVRTPNPLSVFCTGISGNLGNKVKIDFGNITSLPTGNASQNDNPFLNSFLSIDFIGVISILISLLALIFSYDLFTREREDGTMKLSLSNGVSRSRFLSGKILGIMITLLPILILCYLLSILIILLSSSISLDAGQWMSLALLFLYSMVYMTAFILAGAFVSSKVKHSSTSIIISLLGWIWFVFLTPALAKHIAETFVSVEKHDNMAYAINELDREYYQKVNEEIIPAIQKELNLYSRSWWNASGGADGYFETSGTSKECMEFERRLKEESEPIRIDYADKKWIIVKNHQDVLFRQKRLQKNLLMLSPTGMFEMMAAGLCRNDESAINNFMEEVRSYRETLIQYFESHKLFADFRYITPQPLDEIVSMEEQQRIAKSGQIPDSWSNRNNPALNLEGVPLFNYQENSIPTLLYQSLLQIMLLLLICSLLLIFTIRSFHKYDVR